MGAIAIDGPRWVRGNPYAYARAKRIAIHEIDGWPFEVGADERSVIVRPHVDDRVTRSRVCEGIAQCLLSREGVAWSTPEAAHLGRLIERRFDALAK